MDPRLFQAFPAEVRDEMESRYVDYCYARFGAPDFVARTFEKRETFLETYRAASHPRWNGDPITQTEFDRYYHGDAPVDEAPELVAWLVRMARSNAIEGWGVRYHLDRSHYEREFADGHRPTARALATMQELYHDELLREAVRLFGLEFELHLPGWGMQQMFKSSSYLPEAVGEPLTLVTEIIGSVAFLDMRNRAEVLLARDSELLACVRHLIDEVIIDEIGHVTVLLATLNGPQLVAARRATPIISAVVQRFYHRDSRRDGEQLRRDVSRYSLDLFPVEVLQQAFVPEAYWSPRAGSARTSAERVTTAS